MSNLPQYMMQRRMEAGDGIARIMVFGCTGAGKSTFVNDASCARLTVGHDLVSSTRTVQTSPIFQIDNQSVQLYDTPGFDDTKLTDTEILKMIAEALDGMHRTGQKVTGLVYMHRITDKRFSGASVRGFELFTKICGLSKMRNAIILTSMWSADYDPEGELREQQLRSEFFRTAIENGARMARRANPGPQSAHAVVRQLMGKAHIELDLQTELARGYSLCETQAGMLVEQNLRVRLERQRREREELEEELQQAREDRDRRAAEQLERYKRNREEEEMRLRMMIEELQAARGVIGARPPTQSQHIEDSTFRHLPTQPEQERRANNKWAPKLKRLLGAGRDTAND